MKGISVPTDNLYKFMAIFGLVCIVSAAIGIMLARDSNVNVWKQSVENNYKIQISIKKPTEREKEILDLYSEQLSGLIESSNNKMDFVVSRMLYLATFGLFVSGFGFFFWYRKKQVYEDEIIVLELEQLKNRSNNGN